MTPADSTDERLSDDLTMRVLAITGVDRVFPSASAAARLTHLVAALTTREPEPPSRVEVGDDDGATAVTARIATRREGRTPQTARHVADALLQRLPPGQDATVRVHIAQIR